MRRTGFVARATATVAFVAIRARHAGGAGRRAVDRHKARQGSSRAENCVASLKFANPKHCFSLQASHLLACLAVKALADRPGSKLAAPVWPKALAGLPGPAADSICEFWDKTRIDRYLDSVV